MNVTLSSVLEGQIERLEDFVNQPEVMIRLPAPLILDSANKVLILE
jgi:hypothetical protein